MLHEKISNLSNRTSFSRLLNRIVQHRRSVILIAHLVLFALSYLFSFLMLSPLMEGFKAKEVFQLTILPIVLIRSVVFAYHDLFQGLWRYVSFSDLLNIIRATAIGSILFALIGILFTPLRVPDRIMVLDLVFCIGLVGGARFLVRDFRERHIPKIGAVDKEQILLIGLLSHIQPLVNEIQSDPLSRYHIVAIIDPTQRVSKLVRISDLPVMSLNRFLRETRRYEPLDVAVISWPEATKRQLDNLIESLKSLNIQFKTLPRSDEILSGKVSISDIRNVEIDNLLGRPPVSIESDLIGAYLRGKSVLVTGGSGSIGSELCRQIAVLQPRVLVIVERSESSLYDLREELDRRFPDLVYHASISSVNDRPGIKDLFEKYHVDVVFHAAAYKHVPLMEAAPLEAAYNNILGTYNVARSAVEVGVGRFVMISTDKAVNPVNVMGVTKRIAEMIVQSMNCSDASQYMTVRFGNVLGSAGSVIPIFKEQIARGGPVTVTDPNMVRYFMTIPEAVQLVLQAGSVGQGGQILVLDTGQPVKIVELAEKLITLSGKRPHEDIEILYTGIRPGEKLYEELLCDNELKIPTTHPQIMVALSNKVERDFVESQVQEIREILARRDDEKMRIKFKQLVPSYRP